MARRGQRAADKPHVSGGVYGIYAIQTQEGTTGGDENAVPDQRPTQQGEAWLFDLPARPSPDTPRRSEIHWSVDGAWASHGDGDLVHFEAVFVPHLGEASAHDFDWHVLWQLHGPNTSGVWEGPAMSLNIRNGHLRLDGGAGHVDHDSGTHNMEWSYTLGSYKDGVATRVRVESLLSSNPDVGWVSVWVDGTQAVNHWVPVSAAGYKPGTYYNQYVAQRSGLYRGTQSVGATDGGYTSVIPTYRQWVTTTPLSMN